MPYGTALFRNGDLGQYLEQSVAQLAYLVEHRYQGPHETLTDEQIAKGIAEEAAFQPLVVDFDNPLKNAASTTVRVHDFGREIEVEGLLGTYSFHFTGDAALFGMRPNSLMNPPHGTVEGNRVIVGVTGRNNPEQIKAALEREVERLNDHVQAQRSQIEEHNRQLWQRVMPFIQRRKQALAGVNNLRDLL